MVTVRTIQMKDRQSFEELHWNNYWRSHCLILNRDFYRWQFMDFQTNNITDENDHSIVAVDDNGKILSYMGLIPIKASFDGQIINAAHLISWLTAPEAQGQGIGNKIISYITEKFDFLYGRSVTPAALSVYQKFGFRYFKNCSRWIAILDPHATSELAVEQSDISNKRIYARTVNKATSIKKFYISQEVPLGAAEMSEAVLAKSVAFIRSHDYLTWRYEQHPYLPYVFLSLNNPSSPSAIAVLRVEDVAERSEKVLRVIEFITPQKYSYDLAQCVFDYGVQNGCAYADIFGVSEHFVSGFVAAGGFNSIEETQLGLPYLLQPYDTDINPPGLLFWGRRNISSSTNFGPTDDISNIYVSKGDGNMDWPSWNSNPIAPPTRLAN